MRFFFLFLLLANLTAPALADMTATYRHLEQDGSIIVEVADNGDARLEISGQNWRLQIVGGEPHIVYMLPVGERVTRISALEQLFAERRPSMEFPDTVPGARLVERGRYSQGGHSGRAYYLQTADGTSSRPVIVVSDDRALAPLGVPLRRQLDFSMVTIALSGTQVSPLMVRMRELISSGTALLFAGYALQRIDGSHDRSAAASTPRRRRCRWRCCARGGWHNSIR